MLFDVIKCDLMLLKMMKCRALRTTVSFMPFSLGSACPMCFTRQKDMAKTPAEGFRSGNDLSNLL